MENLPLNEQDFIPLGASASEGEVLAGKPMTYWQDAWQRFRKNKVALFAAILLVIIALFTIFGPAICGYDFAAQNVKIRNQAPSAEHWFGTDSLGRDLFARVAVGGRVSIIIGICGALIVGVIGCLYGGLAAYFGGRVDMVMMRIVDILSSIPNLLLVILLSVVLESSSIPTLLFAMTITSWCGVARIVRAQMLQINRSEYVMAARIMGVFMDYGFVLRNYVRYRLNAKDEYSIHSPFMFDLFTKGLQKNSDRSNYKGLDVLVKEVEMMKPVR